MRKQDVGRYGCGLNILCSYSGLNQDKVEGQGEVGGASQAFPQRRQQETPRQYPTKSNYHEPVLSNKGSGLQSSSSGRAQQRWVPPSSTNRPEYHTNQERHNHIFRRVRGILNKLTPEKFDKLVLELLNVGIDSKVVLKGIILLVFDKALEEPKYSAVYAQLCKRLDEDAPSFEPPGSTSRTFRRLLINKCQDEFENRSQAFAAFENKNGNLTPDEEEQRHITKQKMLGNIQFIGELGKLEMLHESILHKCIKQLLYKRSSETFREKAEDLECLCKIMNTVGRRLDHDKARSWMDQYFERMTRFSEAPELPARIRFMLQDCLELRRNNWVLRHCAVVQGPRTIRQIHQDAFKDSGMSMDMGRSHGEFFGPLNGDRGLHGGWESRGAMSDIFLQDTMSGKVGTGPGTIEMDSYAHFMMQQQQQQMRNPQRNMDRQNQGNYQGNYNNPPPRLQQHMNQQGMGMGKDGGGGGYMGQRSNLSGQRDNKPPRMSKMTSDQLNLRPNSSNISLKPQGPSMLPPSTKKTSSQPPSLVPSKPNNPTPSSQQPPVGNLQSGFPPLSVKQSTSSERGKQAKKQTPSKEDLLKSMETLMKSYLTSDDLTAAVDGWKDLRVAGEYVAALLCSIMTEALTKGDTERESVSKFITALKQNDAVTSAQFIDGFTSLLERSTDLEAEVALIKSHMASLAARAIVDDVAHLADIAKPLESGAYYPLFLLCLQKLHKMKDKEWLVNLFSASKVNMMLMLPEIDQRKERMMDILDDKGLSFLFPLLRVQADIWKQITTEPNPSALYKWIRDNIPTKIHADKGFINALATSIIKFVTSQTTLAEGIDSSVAPDKPLQDKERALLEKFKAVLQKFVHESVALQLSALYALQVHCNNSGFPKGMLLRFFVNFYNMEVIEEEAFLKWKEDISDEHPGKGKALFQVNQWLTWLATAEEEEDSEDEDPDQ
ncbi:eukaryotic translation initiation factor 4 gamma 2-like [Acanthaster planci]|uniref:Eukaryotic translation initiation factor 4 gamma 2 n=1 Tax=Acanthaster planci TaxID=133434 RepID=A0A8B7ZNC9_ACAPL|nr:eukaryotic translation initiation factor 4 gamma 2-like [Acanthaster planci]